MSKPAERDTKYLVPVDVREITLDVLRRDGAITAKGPITHSEKTQELMAQLQLSIFEDGKAAGLSSYTSAVLVAEALSAILERVKEDINDLQNAIYVNELRKNPNAT